MSKKPETLRLNVLIILLEQITQLLNQTEIKSEVPLIVNLIPASIACLCTTSTNPLRMSKLSPNTGIFAINPINTRTQPDLRVFCWLFEEWLFETTKFHFIVFG